MFIPTFILRGDHRSNDQVFSISLIIPQQTKVTDTYNAVMCWKTETCWSGCHFHDVCHEISAALSVHDAREERYYLLFTRATLC